MNFKRIENKKIGLSTFIFPEIKTTQLKIIQPKKGGSKYRPNLMWVREICVY